MSGRVCRWPRSQVATATQTSRGTPEHTTGHTFPTYHYTPMTIFRHRGVLFSVVC